MDVPYIKVPILSDYKFSDTVGFLLESPWVDLDPYYKPWVTLATRLSQLLKEKKLRKEVDKLHLLDHTRLRGYRQHRLAFSYLSFIANGYVWQDGDMGVVQVLPRQISIPFCSLASYLGLMPCLGHTAFCLNNWKPIDPEKELVATNLDVGLKFTDSSDNRFFTTITSEIEVKAIYGVKAAIKLIQSIVNDECDTIIEYLGHIESSILNMAQSFDLFHEKVNAEVFFDEIRPFLAGWGTEGSALPDGLIYDGVSNIPRKVNGGSAAQSSTLNFFDAALGVRHRQDEQTFLDDMLNYMPYAHRQLILDIRKISPIRNYVFSNESDEGLVKAYSACLAALTHFRSKHIKIVTKYIIIPSKRASRNTNFERVASKGTGGSDLLPFLKNIRKTTN